jgi:uncharacterized protein (DUF983 family)
MTAVSPFAAGLACACPRCGKGRLFGGYLKLASACSVCGLDYAKADSGDGPAVFVIFVVGFVAVSLAFIARFVWDWSIAAALALSAGTTLIASLGLLRIFKATLIALQFTHDAEEGRPVE